MRFVPLWNWNKFNNFNDLQRIYHIYFFFSTKPTNFLFRDLKEILLQVMVENFKKPGISRSGGKLNGLCFGVDNCLKMFS